MMAETIGRTDAPNKCIETTGDDRSPFHESETMTGAAMDNKENQDKK
jgi:hypothetical protein